MKGLATIALRTSVRENLFRFCACDSGTLNNNQCQKLKANMNYVYEH